MGQLDTSYTAQEFENVGVVDMTSVMFIIGENLYVDLKDLLPDPDSYNYDPNMTDAERKEHRLKSWALQIVIDGYEALEQKLGLKVIFIHNSTYYAASDLFDV